MHFILSDFRGSRNSCSQMMSEQATEVAIGTCDKDSESWNPIVLKAAAIQWVDSQDSSACRLTTTQPYTKGIDTKIREV